MAPLLCESGCVCRGVSSARRICRNQETRTRISWSSALNFVIASLEPVALFEIRAVGVVAVVGQKAGAVAVTDSVRPRHPEFGVLPWGRAHHIRVGIPGLNNMLCLRLAFLLGQICLALRLYGFHEGVHLCVEDHLLHTSGRET